MLQSTLGLENSPKNVQKYEPVVRFLIDPIPIVYMMQSTLGLENSPKNVQKYETVVRFLIDPIPITLRHLLFRFLILHVAVNFRARKFTKKGANVIFF
jgi:hypothetical protein